MARTSASRVASTYLQRQVMTRRAWAEGSWEQWYDDEVLDKEAQEAIKAFLKGLVVDGQRVFNLIDTKEKKAIKTVQNPTGQLTKSTVLKVMLKHVAENWGDDEMAPYLAKTLAFGDYVW